ncbi:MAG TPA: SDR family NAD(P)-dependent oxidoreductase [Actinocrinis sp.]|nr:SDR family NAD(P)-dependent oxidoreductase [Actinocrinis sp.]
MSVLTLKGGGAVVRWMVTGCSSGLGRALAEAAAGAGDRVVATARRLDALEDLAAGWPDAVVPVALDVRDAQQCEQAVALAAERMGGIDVLVNNAGTGLFGAVEEVCDEELRDQFEAQVVGPWRLIRLVLPVMRDQGAGHIVNVSSIAGRMAVPGLAAYIAAKHALEGMSQALAEEVAAHGIRVTVMEPGGFATRYGTALAETGVRLPAYGAVHESIGMYRGMDQNPALGRPDEFARAVLKVVGAAAPTPLRIPVGPGAYEMLGANQQAAAQELDTAGALVGRTTVADGAAVG